MNKRHYEHTLPNIRGSLSNTYGDTAEGNINEVATKGGTGYRGAAMFPSGRKNRGQKGKRKEPCFSEKRTAAFHEWLVFTKGYGAAKRER